MIRLRRWVVHPKYGETVPMPQNGLGGCAARLERRGPTPRLRLLGDGRATVIALWRLSTHSVLTVPRSLCFGGAAALRTGRC